MEKVVLEVNETDTFREKISGCPVEEKQPDNSSFVTIYKSNEEDTITESGKSIEAHMRKIYGKELKFLSNFSHIDVFKNLECVKDFIDEKFLGYEHDHILTFEHRVQYLQFISSKNSVMFFCKNLCQDMGIFNVTFYGRLYGNFNLSDNLASRAGFIIVKTFVYGITVSFLLDLGSFSGVNFKCFAPKGEYLDSTKGENEFYKSFLNALDRTISETDESTSSYSRKNKEDSEEERQKSLTRTEKTLIVDTNIVFMNNIKSSVVSGHVKTTNKSMGCIFLGNTEKITIKFGNHTYQINLKTGDSVIYKTENDPGVLLV